MGQQVLGESSVAHLQWGPDAHPSALHLPGRNESQMYFTKILPRGRVLPAQGVVQDLPFMRW